MVRQPKYGKYILQQSNDSPNFYRPVTNGTFSSAKTINDRGKRIPKSNSRRQATPDSKVSQTRGQPLYSHSISVFIVKEQASSPQTLNFSFKPTSKEIKPLRIITYNYKHMETSLYAFHTLSKTDVFLIQEHWYFDCQLVKLDAFSEAFNYCGKAWTPATQFYQYKCRGDMEE